MTKKISLFSLVILIISAIDNIRNLPAAAIFGDSLFFFFLLAGLIFLIPTALVSAELSAAFHETGGIYQWVNRAFNKKWALLAIWLQWINTMVWYPTILSFIAGTFAYLINPELVQNKGYLISCILIVFWTMTLINLKGIHVSTLINNICAIGGTMIPMLLLIALGFIWYISGKPLQISLKPQSFIPNLSDSGMWVSLVAIMASFLGIELSGVHVNDIDKPQKNFPKGVLFASLFIFLTMVSGSLAIAIVLPEKEINLVSGVMQVFSSFFHAFHLEGLIPVLTIMIAFGSMGTMINWLISPAKGLLHAAEYGFLPRFFTKKNKAGVAQNILLTQATLVTLFCLVFLLVPSVNAFYWFLTALSTELYMIMYIMMFLAGIFLHYRYKERPQSFKIPGKNLGMWITTLIGILGCLLTIAVSFLPPTTVDVGNPLKYFSMIGIGNMVTILPVVLLLLYEKKKRAKG